jgi:hypothetical protein
VTVNVLIPSPPISKTSNIPLLSKALSLHDDGILGSQPNSLATSASVPSK